MDFGAGGNRGKGFPGGRQSDVEQAAHCEAAKLSLVVESANLPARRWEHEGNDGPVLFPLQMFHVLRVFLLLRPRQFAPGWVSDLCRAKMLRV